MTSPSGKTHTNSSCKVDRGAREEGAEAYTSYAAQADRPSNDGLRSKWNWYHAHSIQAPGYHIVPKYDLPRLRSKMKSRKKKKSAPPLPLTSMIDLLSTLVIFLILNFSEDGDVFFASKESVLIPQASNATVLNSLPQIAIAPEGVYLDVPESTGLSISIFEPNLDNPSALLTELRRLKTALAETQGQGGLVQSSSGADQEYRVNLMSDQKVPMGTVKKVIRRLVEEGWAGIHFAVRKKSGSR